MKNIIIHCSASPNGRNDRASDIHRWHTEKGWSGIGYHYVICVDGAIETGRPEYWQGAHASGHNRDSIGICLIGTDSFDNKQLNSLNNLVKNLTVKYPNAEIIGHNEISAKTCPGFNVQEWLKTI